MIAENLKLIRAVTNLVSTALEESKKAHVLRHVLPPAIKAAKVYHAEAQRSPVVDELQPALDALTFVIGAAELRLRSA